MLVGSKIVSREKEEDESNEIRRASCSRCKRMNSMSISLETLFRFSRKRKEKRERGKKKEERRKERKKSSTASKKRIDDSSDDRSTTAFESMTFVRVVKL